MPKKNFVDFRAVKATVTMEQVLQHYGLLEKMKRSGDNLSGCCPIHKGSNPTQFRVSLERHLWNCFGECKHGGNVLDFIARMENVSIHAAALKAIEWFKLDVEQVFTNSGARPAESPEREESKPAPQPKPVPQTAPTAESSASNTPLKFRLEKLQCEHPYFIEHGLTPETLADFGAGFCSKGMMAERIAIPICNPDGKIVAYAGRWPGEPPNDTPKYKFPQGFRKSLELFNLNRAIKEPAGISLIIVEDFFDVMKLYQYGYRKVVALMDSTMSLSQEDLIRQHTTCESRLIIMLDEDEEGRKGREDLAIRLARWAFVRIHLFKNEGAKPEHMTTEQVTALSA